jgi:hypothetical protein
MKTITLEFTVQMTKTFIIPKDKEKLIDIVIRPCSEWTMEEAELACDYDLYQFVSEQTQFNINDISNLIIEDFED